MNTWCVEYVAVIWKTLYLSDNSFEGAYVQYCLLLSNTRLVKVLYFSTYAAFVHNTFSKVSASFTMASLKKSVFIEMTNFSTESLIFASSLKTFLCKCFLRCWRAKISLSGGRGCVEDGQQMVSPASLTAYRFRNRCCVEKSKSTCSFASSTSISHIYQHCCGAVRSLFFPWVWNQSLWTHVGPQCEQHDSPMRRCHLPGWHVYRLFQL